MIVGLSGAVELKEPTFLHIVAGGITYEVHISLYTYGLVNDKNIKLHITQIIREDAHLLFGFAELGEKRLFERLVKINGVGPKVALAICSTFSPSQFVAIIQNNDVNGLKKVPGIGPKSAGRILVELSGFDAILTAQSVPVNSNSEAYMALESLGFKGEQIAKVLAQCKSTETAPLVKEALKLLQGNV